jgi:hypothetical protein
MVAKGFARRGCREVAFFGWNKENVYETADIEW